MMKQLLAVILVFGSILFGFDGAQAETPARRISSLGAGINLTAVNDWNTELPFNDQFKMSRRWISQRKASDWGKGPELDIDERGYVRKLEPDCWAETVLFIADEPFVYPEGQFTLLYDGKGRLELTHSKIISESPGQIIFVPEGGRKSVFLQLRETDPEDYVRNIRVYFPDVDPEKSGIFRQQFLDRWSGMKALRFMDWMRTNNSPVVSWKDRPVVEDASWASKKGVPLEIMVQLSNTLKINPWFCVPHQADDDYVRNMARLLRDTVDPSLKIYIEYSNELWNSMFAQSRYAQEQGIRRGLADKGWEAGWLYTAKRSVEIFQIFEQEFGGKDRLVRVISAHSANPYIARQILRYENTYENADVLAIAPYLGMNLKPEGSDEELDARTVADWSVEQVMNHLNHEILPKTIQQIREHKRIAEEFGLELVAYEAGQHLTGIQGAENNQRLIDLFKQVNRSSQMGELYSRYLEAWQAEGGGLICMFASTSRWTKWGMWGLLESWQQDIKDIPKAKATFDWHHKVALQSSAASDF